MVRVGGMTFSCEPGAKMGARIGDMRIGERAVESGRTYKVASWASVAEGVRDEGEPVWICLPVPAREEGREAAQTQRAAPDRRGRQPRPGLNSRPNAPILPKQVRRV